MWQKVKNIWYPERYHGANIKGPFFEGWYYKIISRKKDQVIAVIPGIYFDKVQHRSHSFIQFLDSEFHEILYRRFKVIEFMSDKNSFNIKIGNSVFNKNSITLDLETDNHKINGTLYFSGHYPWPISAFSPGAMGWYSFVPFMECYHGVLSFDHHIKGTLCIDDQAIDFTDGRGYMEKDWGISFPRAYIWMQSNHFEDIGTSLFISVALIPWLRGAFRGFLAGFLFRGRLLRMTTYTGAIIEKLTIANTYVHIVIRDRKYSLEVRASRTEGGILFGPDGQGFLQHITETLKSQIELIFSDRGGIIFKGIGSPAGLEINGKTELIE